MDDEDYRFLSVLAKEEREDVASLQAYLVQGVNDFIWFRLILVRESGLADLAAAIA
jgi:hypothetical protein